MKSYIKTLRAEIRATEEDNREMQIERGDDPDIEIDPDGSENTIWEQGYLSGLFKALAIAEKEQARDNACMFNHDHQSDSENCIRA